MRLDKLLPFLVARGSAEAIVVDGEIVDSVVSVPPADHERPRFYVTATTSPSRVREIVFQVAKYHRSLMLVPQRGDFENWLTVAVALAREQGKRIVLFAPSSMLVAGSYAVARSMLGYCGRVNFYITDDLYPEARTGLTVVEIMPRQNANLAFLYREFYIYPVLNAVRRLDGSPLLLRSPLTDKLDGMAVCSLGDVAEVRVAPRTSQLEELGAVRLGSGETPDGYVPVLSAGNIKRGKVEVQPTGWWLPEEKKEQWPPAWGTEHAVMTANVTAEGLRVAINSGPFPFYGEVFLIRLREFALFPISLKDLVQLLNHPLLTQYMRDRLSGLGHHMPIPLVLRIPVFPPDVLTSEQVKP